MRVSFVVCCFDTSPCHRGILGSLPATNVLSYTITIVLRLAQDGEMIIAGG